MSRWAAPVDKEKPMSLPEPAALEVDDLTVAYQDNIALSHTSLSLPTGEALALLGPNGAGKSTLMKAILGLIPTLTGSVQIFGKPLNQMRRRILVTGHDAF
ncbi:MAG: ATP-binding cassette domain-containing protein, partial [Cutibacterium avidum]|nr:ATP-binding cassette domain-containing protein [Cutibacterium avidum]